MWAKKRASQITIERFFQLGKNLFLQQNIKPNFVKKMPGLKQKDKMEKRSEKVSTKNNLAVSSDSLSLSTIWKPKSSFDKSDHFLSYNKFAHLNIEEITEEEDYTENISPSSSTFVQNKMKDKLKASRKKIIRKKKTVQTERTETIKK